MISCSDEHEVIVTERLANAAILKRFEHLSVALGPLQVKEAPGTLIVLFSSHVCYFNMIWVV